MTTEQREREEVLREARAKRYAEHGSVYPVSMWQEGMHQEFTRLGVVVPQEWLDKNANKIRVYESVGLTPEQAAQELMPFVQAQLYSPNYVPSPAEEMRWLRNYMKAR